MVTEALLLEWMKTYGYGILFVWSMLEGESGLVMAGLFSHTGDMNLFIAIFIAGLGAFAGDQLYFYIGRFNKRYAYKAFKKQRRKLALAHLLLKKYGAYIIFMQRYLYGLRTLIPLSIGLTRYSAQKFALINLLSAWCWAAFIITPVWYFGDVILGIITWIRAHWYFALPILLTLVVFIYLTFQKATQKNRKFAKKS